MAMTVKHFFDANTSTLSYVVSDDETAHCAIIDPVLDLDYASGTLSTDSADTLIAYVQDSGLAVDCILETHIHADHLSSAPYIQARLGGDIAIGGHITTVQQTFGTIFNEDGGFRRDGSQFDRILHDGDTFAIGNLHAEAYHVPGHTPACMAYRVQDALFVGDTLFMPAFFHHEVHSHPDDDGGNVAANFWFTAQTEFVEEKAVLSRKPKTSSGNKDEL